MKSVQSCLRQCSACRRRSVRPTPQCKLADSFAKRQYTRPAFAPKPAIDIKHIRQNPGLYSQNCRDRNYEAHAETPSEIIRLHQQWLDLQRNARGLRERSNHIRRQLANAASRSGDAEGDIRQTEDKDALLREAKELKTELSEIEIQEAELQDKMTSLAEDLPNLSSTSTPIGDTPETVEYINKHPEPHPDSSDRVWRSHVHIGSELSLMDFAGAAQTSGWGFYFLTNEGAMLEQALIQYALSVARKRGWKVVAPPSMVYSHIAAACGFQPRDQGGEQQIYAIEQAEKDKLKPQLALAGTAEIPMAGMKANQILEEVDLPLKMVGVSRAYRAEAGARGVDTKGLYRVHEFTKVELFAWTMPDSTEADPHFVVPKHASSEAIFKEIVDIQKEILGSLGLHCRLLEMPTHDLGASATRKQDIEAFFPSRREKDDGWGEVSSASMCTDYQSRRLHTKVRLQKSGKLDFPLTLNGTAIAVPRVLAAVLENHWDEDQCMVRIPKVLWPWMDGIKKIEGHAWHFHSTGSY